MRLLHRLRHHVAAGDAVPGRFEIERAGLSSPKSFQDFDIGRAALVALIVRYDFKAHHPELARAPSADDVEAPAAFADVVDGSAHLRGQNWMKYRDVDGRKNLDAFGDREERSRPGHGFERDTEIVSLAAEAPPFCDRKKKVEAGALRSLGDAS